MATTAPRDATPPRSRPAKSKPQLVVELRRRPAKYVPGSGPPSQPVTLMPAHDSTAFIVDRILLASPGLAKDGKPLPRRMTYIVGWTDLPAARVLVPAMKVLDYVSPWALEEWEYQFELELEEEREALAREKELEQRELAEPAQQGPEGRKVKEVKKKKRGRPPTHKHTQIKAGAVALPDTEDQPSSPHRVRTKPGSISLSTPQKTRLTDFEDISEEEGTPSRQFRQAQVAEDIEEELRGERIQSPTVAFTAPKITPVPLPPMPHSAFIVQQRTLPGMFSRVSAGSGFSSESSSKSSTPVPLPVLPPLRPFQSKQSAPSPQSSLSQLWTAHRNGNLAPPVSSHTPVLPPLHPPSAGSTPVHSGPASLESQTTTSKSPRKRKRKDKPLLDENGMTVWVVKRIEDEGLFESEGEGMQRLYKVRWEGDWPPEENPTWEPAENLPPSLIRNWQKTAPKMKARLSKGLSPKLHASSPKKKTKMKQSRLDWVGTQKISSVSDVFQGEGEDKNQLHDHMTREYQRDEDADDELLLVDATRHKEERGNTELRGPASGEPSGLAARLSSWGAFFGGR